MKLNENKFPAKNTHYTKSTTIDPKRFLFGATRFAVRNIRTGHSNVLSVTLVFVTSSKCFPHGTHNNYCVCHGEGLLIDKSRFTIGFRNL